jgi:putative oxidoreductase
VVKEEQMNQTPNVQPPTPKAFAGRQLNAEGSTKSAMPSVKYRSLNIFCWLLALVVAGIFIYAGAVKMLDPVQFAHDVKNFQILPWPMSVALAFYLPWLEIFCGFGLIFRFFYRGAVSILAVLIVVFTLATAAAKVRGLDITCGCFGHASQHWSFPAHLATNLGILAALLALWFSNRLARRQM